MELFCKSLNLAKRIIARLELLDKKHQRKDEEIPYIRERAKTNVSSSICHASTFTLYNAGDTLLPVALRDLWALEKNDLGWVSQYVRAKVDGEVITKINHTKGLVIGGGGLFLKDTNKNEISGWQWACATESLAEIKVPVVLFAVGYNRFRGQDDFEPVFKSNLYALAKKCLYMGIRNHGSIEALKKYLPENLHHKLRFQPCMTTMLSLIYPEVTHYASKEDFIAFNAAFDRTRLRFGENIGNILSAIARVLKKLSMHYPVKIYIHMPTDEAILPFMQSYGIKHEVVQLNNLHPRKIIEAYAKPRLAIGMRGHAQMIPFGCNTPIFSVISHDKLQWFLEDLEKPAWGADVLDPDFEQKLYSGCMDVLDNFENVTSHIISKQAEFLTVSKENIREALSNMNLINKSEFV